MSPEAQRIAIADAGGHIVTAHETFSPEQWKTWYDDVVPFIPDYLNDLNAIQEAVCSQPKPIQEQFACELAKRRVATLRMHHQLTAKDWCECLLRVIGKWEESKP